MTANGEMAAGGSFNLSGLEGFKAIAIALENLHCEVGQCLATASKSKAEIPIARRWSCFQTLFVALVLCVMCGLPGKVLAQSALFTGAQATVATGLNEPLGVAVDGAGNLFVANSRIPYLVKVPAGGGSPIPIALPSGDFVSAIAMDSNDNLYIGLSTGAVGSVIKMSAQGRPATSLGSGWKYPSGIVVDSSGDVFVADNGLNKVVELLSGGGQLTLNFSIAQNVWSVAVDNDGNVFVSDYDGNDRVVALPAGSSTPVSKSVGGLASAIATDAAGNLFVVVSQGVVELPAGGGALTTLGVTGLDNPFGLAVDSADDVFIADFEHNRVVEFETRAVNFASANVCPAGQSSPAPCSNTVSLNYAIPAGGDIGIGSILTLGAPNLDFALASGSTCAGHFEARGTCTVNVTFAPKYAGPREGVVHITDDLGNVLASTNIYGIGNGPQIAFSSNKQITVGSGFSSPESYPTGVATDGAGDVFVADGYGVYKVPAGGGATTTIGTGLISPTQVAVDGAGNVFIVDQGNYTVYEVPAGGGAQTTVGSPFVISPVAVAVNGVGDVFILDYGRYSVVKVPAAGGANTILGTGLVTPLAIAVDGAGDLFIADTGNGRVVELPADGSAQTTVVSGLASPAGISVDAAGNVYIAEGSGILEALVATGTHTTLGTGLNGASGVAVDSAGNVFIADSNNARVVELPRSQPPALSFVATNVNSTSTDSPQTVVLENIGNQPLDLTGISFPVDFPEGTSEDGCTISSSLIPGQQCSLPVNFTPLLPGSLSETLKLTDNAPNATAVTQSITLSGSGVSTSQVPAALTSPTPGSTLTGPTVTFKWTAATGAGNQGYWLFLGTTGVGSKNLYDSNQQTATSATANNLPTNGEKIYARVYTKFNGVLVFNDYTYTAWMKPPVLTSPTPGGTLTSASATFTWTAASSGEQGYWLFLGTTGVGSKNLYDSGQQAATSATFSNLPTDGVKIYARVYTRYNGVLVYNDYTYPSWRKPPVMTSPAPGSTLAGASVKFSWTAETGDQGYWLFLGTTGVGSKNLYDSGQQTATSATFSGLPTNGETIYARVYTTYNGVLVYNDYTYKAE